MPSRAATSLNSPCHHCGFLSMSQKVSPPTSDLSKAVIPIKRELSWQVASNLFVSFKYAWCGINYAFQTQRNFRIHVSLGTLAICLGVFLHLSPGELAAIVLTSGLVLVMELINTAIESVVDLAVKQTYHELAKVAKDCAAGAVLVSAIAAVLVAAVLLLPRLIVLIQSVLR